ncbi:hypothetical protein MMC17_008437 [Xylographa soralifera]|nr:hypothetical protein [Xylographa soralifera]
METSNTLPFSSRRTLLTLSHQAEDAGRKLRSLLKPSDTLHFFTSPYLRTRETTEGILSSLTSSDPSPSPFQRHAIKVYEEPRLREQDFGNFQPCSAEMTRMWQERADYGHFFYRIPNGESAADAYDRVSGFNESLWRSFGEEDFASVCVLVTHGLMARVFLMKWYHYSVEYFEDLRNVNHCEFVVMRLDRNSGKYDLQNQLRTWSELREEKRAKESGSPIIPVRKKWGGCPDGCDHTAASKKRATKRQNTSDLFLDDGTSGLGIMETHLQRKGSKADTGEEGSRNEMSDIIRGRAFSPHDKEGHPSADKHSTSLRTNGHRNNKERVPSLNRLDVLKTGRDGGGSLSGAASRSGSEESTDREREVRQSRRYPSSMALALSGGFEGEEGMRIGQRADALGDQSDAEEGEEDMERQDCVDRDLPDTIYHPLADPPTPPSKEDPIASHPSLTSPFSLAPSLASLTLSPTSPDFSFLLHPSLYHPLTNLNTPAPFRTSAHAPTADTPLPTLLAHGHFRPAATLAASLLTTPPQPTLPADIFPLFYVRLACLALIGAVPLAAQEAQALGDLAAPLYRHPLTGAHLVPWELRVLAVRLGGGGAREVAAYYELAREARAEVRKGSGAEREVWRGRLTDLGARVAGALLLMGDGAAAGRLLRGLRGEGVQEGLWRGRMGLLYLKIGDVKAAREFIAPAPATATAASDPAEEDPYAALLRPLLSLAEGDYDLAVSQFSALRDATPSADPLVTQNLAVCLIYAGRLVDARPLMEELVDGGYAFQTLLFNLATVYELCSEKARGLKLELAGRVAGREGRAWGWERGEVDFKL